MLLGAFLRLCDFCSWDYEAFMDGSGRDGWLDRCILGQRSLVVVLTHYIVRINSFSGILTSSQVIDLLRSVSY